MTTVLRALHRVSLMALLCAAPLARGQEAAEAAPAPAPGHLEVTADVDGAEVQLDGAVVGRTPLTLDAVAAGIHQVSVSSGARRVSRAVTVGAGASSQLAVVLPAASAENADNRPVPAAMKELGQSVMDLPWAALSVGVTFALVLTAVVMLTTSPADIPLLADAGVDVPRNAWRGAAVGALLAALVVGTVSVVLLALRLEPVRSCWASCAPRRAGSTERSPETR